MEPSTPDQGIYRRDFTPYPPPEALFARGTELKLVSYQSKLELVPYMRRKKVKESEETVLAHALEQRRFDVWDAEDNATKLTSDGLLLGGEQRHLAWLCKTAPVPSSIYRSQECHKRLLSHDLMHILEARRRERSEGCARSESAESISKSNNPRLDNYKTCGVQA